MRYVIGIDLGTTNSALSFVDTQQPSLSIQQFAIPQLAAEGRVEYSTTLPSFCYLIGTGEWAANTLRLPWKEETFHFVGRLAKTEGAKVPTRLIQSAKSWLCNVAANRRDKILPIEAADLSQRMSPVEVSARYLIHLKEAWNTSIAKGNPEEELEEQEIILTVPASFDEIARHLTVEAATQAGFRHVTLLEEPQAAFYSWISEHEAEWIKLFRPGDVVLICDIGGGTTDFSLIQIEEDDGTLSFQRNAVGNHLLLGGDNMDATLAHYLEKQLEGQGAPVLESGQWQQLLAQTREAKEFLLSPQSSPEQRHPIVIQGKGSSVIKGSSSTSISRKEVEDLLLNGFFKDYPLEEALQIHRSRGFRTMGLPYEDEPSITKHLALFLQQSHFLEKEKGIDYILFNGGAIKPESFQKAIQNAIKKWFPGHPLQRLSSTSLDLAVSRGAAYYGKASRGHGISINGGLPRSYYLKIDVKEASGFSSKAITLVPRKAEEGYHFRYEHPFQLRPNQPIAFHLLTSHVRLNDSQGDLVEIDPQEMQSLPPIQTILRFGKKTETTSESETIPAFLAVRLTAIGTLELWLESQKSSHQWILEFQVRSASGQAETPLDSQKPRSEEIFSQGELESSQQLIQQLFQRGSSIKSGQIMELLEAQIGRPRRDWGPNILRELFSSLLKAAAQRKLSSELEARWWNLAGFFLRPGLGYPLDDFRVKELWKIALADIKTPASSDCQIQQWICFRRIAAGLSKGQQAQIASDVLPSILDKKTGRFEVKKKGKLYLYAEQIRMLASFERLDLAMKIRLGQGLIDEVTKESPEGYECWALGRIGARHLLYGSVGQVIPKEVCMQWIESILRVSFRPELLESIQFLLGQLGRKVGQRELNISEQLVNRILDLYPNPHLRQLLTEEHVLTKEEQEEVYGDKLPTGLILEI
jgi:molecular chaperone DnaK (HSP70)